MQERAGKSLEKAGKRILKFVIDKVVDFVECKQIKIKISKLKPCIRHCPTTADPHLSHFTFKIELKNSITFLIFLINSRKV